MTDRPAPDIELADLVSTRIGEGLHLEDSDAVKVRELVLQGKNQKDAWIALCESIADARKDDGNDPH